MTAIAERETRLAKDPELQMGCVLQAEQGCASPKERWGDACVLSYRETSVAGEQEGRDSVL